jgi:ABC-type multidrug transport system fused ATPase/permease subunit
MLVNLFKALIIIILMVNLNWELAVLSVLIIPVLFLIITFLGSMLRNAFKETRKKISRVTEVIEQNISGMKVIKAYGREKESMEDFDKANWDNREAVFRAGKIMGFLFPLFTFIIYAFMSLILLYGGYGLINNGITLLKSNITIGELSAFNSYLTQLIFPIMGLLLFRQISDSALASAERIYLILHEKNSITEPKVPKDAKKIKGEIEFRNVNFNYKSRMLEEKKDLDTLIGRISNPFYKKFIKKNIHALLEENKLRFVERFVNLSDEEKQSFIAAFNNSYNKKKFIEEFSKKIDLDITTKELSRMLEKKIMGEYPAIKIESQTDINSIGEIIKIKELTTSQILEILVNSKIPKDEYESYSEDVKKLMNEYMLNLKRKKEDVLKDINIKIQKGKTVAFVGETGAGKSTIAKLISRFYDVTSGEILIDGINIKDFKTDELRSVIGMVPQDNFLFSGTILENLYYGLDDKPLLNNKVIKITKKLGLHDFIKELPEKYETKLKEMGTNLSVGQRQLICFARVLMINPKILILDEATSSIDPYTEKIIQSAIKKMSVGRTTIIIAHRLSTIKDADMICVMGNGRIIEKGSHEELVKLKGHYYNLLNASKN